MIAVKCTLIACAIALTVSWSAEAQNDTQADQEGYIRFTSPSEGDEMLEGQEIAIRWESAGPIEEVSVYFYYERAPLGGESRGTTGDVLFGRQRIPDTGEASWTIPWIDAPAFRLRIAGYDAEDDMVGDDEIGLRFRPAQLADIPDHAIAIIKDRQRLYYYVDGRIERMHVVSTGIPGKRTPRMQPGDYQPRRGELGKVFLKHPNRWSNAYQVWMPYWIQISSSGSHGIHATSEQYYDRLGTRASAGCIRQHKHDAEILYNMVEVGTPVYIV